MTKTTSQTALKKAEEAYQEAKDKAEKLVDAAKHKFEDAKDKSTEVIHDAKDKAVDLQEDILSYVKENPIKTLSVAAMAALIAGFVARIKK